MKPSDEAYTIMIFRGATSNPLRIRLRKVILRRAFITGIMLCIVQVGIMAHYIVQTGQVVELDTLREEISESRGQTIAFSSAIDDMKQRMLAMNQLNRKLQTMFGLEPDPLDQGVEINGLGGEEIPYENLSGRESAQFSGRANQAVVVSMAKPHTQAGYVENIQHGLIWLDRQAGRQQEALDLLADTAGERVERWASTPSIWPVKGHITSKFGPRISPFTGKKAFHSGLDIGSPRGREVKSPASGKVVRASYDTRMGNYIRVNHGFGIETTYGHLSKIIVKYGRKVKRGDVIGLVGSTGKFSTGPHLHYQIAINDKVVNPVQYILD